MRWSYRRWWVSAFPLSCKKSEMMLRVILGLALLAAVAGLAFLLGRSTAPRVQSTPKVAVVPPPARDEAQTRARAVLPSPEPPTVTPQADLTGPAVLNQPIPDPPPLTST